MAKFESYQQGTPNWIEHMGPDQTVAKQFYADLFGWQYDDQPIDDQGSLYTLAKIEDDTVAGLGTDFPDQQGQPARWNVYLAADDVDEAAAKVAQAGGQVVAGPFDVMDAGRMAFVQDPGGAVVGLWQAGRTIGAERANEPGTNSWNELSVSDVEKTAAFYQEVLGLQPNKQDMGGMGDYTTLDVDGRAVAGAMQLQPGMTPHWNLYLNVEDTDATVARAQDLGAELVAPAMDVPTVGRIAFLRDPQGARFNVIQDASEPA
jgi:predicted enzyme related to lactoylglutathione lyase